MASKELEVYDKIGDPMIAVKQLGNAIAKSRMFGCDNEAQGEVLALECLARRLPPLSLADRFHIVEGKLMMRYDAMLAEFCRQGGEHKILERTADAAEIELKLKGQTLTERFTWEDAQKEPFPFGKDGKVKKNWATPRARRQMLWARCVSEAVRALCPSINHGKYTPEEMDYSDGENGASTNGSGNGNGKHSTTMTAEQAMQQAAEKANGNTSNGQGDVVDAEFTVNADKKPEANSPELCTPAQRQTIGQLWDALGATDEQRSKQLAKRNVKLLRDLTAEQAAELIAKLEAAKSQQVNNLAGESSQQTAKQSVSVYEPCSQVQVDEIKRLLVAAGKEVIEPVKAHLAKFGKTKVAELSVIDADALKIAITQKAMAEFFSRSLLSPELQESTTSKN